ncbi:hypothetical protein EYC80_000084 [Monilinia laxa]|uniref:Uncharacterized protein n=1 Tax=Monilinia laxa TaxID=61186 RepID=A0A5N6K9H1_MONLA|nr:hypothetical protein EYC80_000084 [Monilinia laxa]
MYTTEMFTEERTSSAARQSSLPFATEPLPHRSLSKETKPHHSNPESSKPTTKQDIKLFMFVSSPCNKVECQASLEDNTKTPSHPPFKPLVFYRCGCLEYIKADDLSQYGLEECAPTSTSHHESPAVTPDAEIRFENKKSYLVSVQGEFYLGSGGLFGTLAPRTTDALPQSSENPGVQPQGKPADVDNSLEYRILENPEKFISGSKANAMPKHSDPFPLQRPCQAREQHQHSPSHLHQHQNQHQLPVQGIPKHPHHHLYAHPDPKNPPPLGYRTSEDPGKFINYSPSTSTRKHSDPAPPRHQSAPSNLSGLSRHRTSNPRDDGEDETKSHGSIGRDRRQESHSQEAVCNASQPRTDEGERERQSQEAAPREWKAGRATVEEELPTEEQETQRNLERQPRKEQERLQTEDEKAPTEKEKENRDVDNHDHHPEPAPRKQSSEYAYSPPKLKFNITSSSSRQHGSLNSRSASRSSHGRRSHRSSSASQGRKDRDHEIYYMDNGIEVQHETHSRSRNSKR